MSTVRTSAARLRVVHETRYRYATPVLLSRQLLHLTPRDLAHQHLLSHRLSIEPAPAESTTGVDFFGNRIVRALLTTPHRALTVASESVVTVARRDQDDARRAVPAVDALRAALAAPRAAGDLKAAQFAFASPHVPLGAAAHAYAKTSFAPGRALPEALADLNARIHRDFDFDPAATSVSTPLDEVIAQRRGVCQDFAHLMIACVRSHGLAARYVSGYILTSPPEGHARLIGSDASHAWVAVYCPDPAGDAARWIEFDPTNDCLAGIDHVSLGWGRDFGDVTPTRGVILGGGEQELSVHVTVLPEPVEAAADAAGGDARYASPA